MSPFMFLLQLLSHLSNRLGGKGDILLTQWQRKTEGDGVLRRDRWGVVVKGRAGETVRTKMASLGK